MSTNSSIRTNSFVALLKRNTNPSTSIYQQQQFSSNLSPAPICLQHQHQKSKGTSTNSPAKQFNSTASKSPAPSLQHTKFSAYRHHPINTNFISSNFISSTSNISPLHHQRHQRQFTSPPAPLPQHHCTKSTAPNRRQQILWQQILQ